MDGKYKLCITKVKRSQYFNVLSHNFGSVFDHESICLLSFLKLNPFFLFSWEEIDFHKIEIYRFSVYKSIFTHECLKNLDSSLINMNVVSCISVRTEILCLQIL